MTVKHRLRRGSWLGSQYVRDSCAVTQYDNWVVAAQFIARGLPASCKELRDKLRRYGRI
ncbi:hypothetical protein PUG81_08135 [Erwiniaceae bacterium L1_54_6]|nr:hypothetical protein [Erwiniaceae bacterium L1_54_6]